MSETSIEWTDATWNPTSGCTKVSPGCAHCYIERTPPLRMAGRKFVKGHIPLQLHEDRLAAPLHWRKPRRVFVNSMSDLFHDDVPEGFINSVFRVMADCPRHTFQVLTRRAGRMAKYCGDRWGHFHGREFPPLPNVWLGVSVEDQARADERIPLLLQTPAAVRFLSCEPLLGPVDLTEIDTGGLVYRPLGGRPDNTLGRLHWVIAGGESGPGARPCDLAWVRSLVAQCAAAGVACFVKQLGARPFTSAAEPGVPEGPPYRLTLRDRKGGNPAEWPAGLNVRQFTGED